MVGWIIFLLLLLSALIYVWWKFERRIGLHQSTRDFWNLSNLPLPKKIEGYIYASRTEWYLKPATWKWFLSRLGKNESADTYHGKMLTSADAAKLISVNQPLDFRNLDQVVPYPVAKSIILQNPLPSLAVLECPCRAQRKSPCQPTDVCLTVGEPYTSFIVDHKPDRARRITVQEALEIIAAEEQRGHVHTAWFKDVMHDRFYVICNCCSCCCLGMQSYFRGVPRLVHSGYSPELAGEECSACGICADICPFGAISGDDKPIIDSKLCMGCGLCVSHCPSQALRLILAPHKGIPLDIDRLIQ